MFWIEFYSNCERETEIYLLITTTWAIIPKRCTGSKEATFQRILGCFLPVRLETEYLKKKTPWLLEEKTGIPTLEPRDWTSLEEH